MDYHDMELKQHLDKAIEAIEDLTYRAAEMLTSDSPMLARLKGIKGTLSGAYDIFMDDPRGAFVAPKLPTRHRVMCAICNADNRNTTATLLAPQIASTSIEGDVRTVAYSYLPVCDGHGQDWWGTDDCDKPEGNVPPIVPIPLQER